MLGIDSKIARSAWAQASVYTIVLLMLCVIWVIRRTILVFATALMLAYLLYPFVDGIDRRLGRKNRTLAVGLPFLFIFGLLGIFSMFIRTPLQNEYNSLHSQIQQKGFAQHVSNWRPLDLPIGVHLVDMYNDNQVAVLIPELGKALRTGARYTLNFFIIPILSFFILKDGRRIRDSLLGVLDTKCRAESLLSDAHTLLLEYMRALLFLCLTTLVSLTIALTVMHVPYPILLALLSFPLEFVPMVGPLTSAIVIVGVSQFNNYGHLSWVVGLLIAYRLFQDYVLSPHLMRKGVQLHPLLVLFGVFAGGEIGSVPGIFLSVPVLALMRLLLHEWRASRAICRDLNGPIGETRGQAMLNAIDPVGSVK